MNYAILKSAIVQVIKDNGNNEITGNILQNVLVQMVGSLGEYYHFGGVVNRASEPNTPDQNVFYIASETAVYPNFGNLESRFGYITFFFWGQGRWQKAEVDIKTMIGLSIIGTASWEVPTDQNVFSALKALQMFLRRDEDDTANGKITFNRGLQIGQTFMPGYMGKGGLIDEDANGELESLRLRSWLEVPEIRFNRVNVYIGIRMDTNGGGIIEKVIPAEDGSEMGWAYLKLQDGEAGAVEQDDMNQGIWHDVEGGNATETTDNRRGLFTFKGFKTVYFRIDEIPSVDPEGQDNSDRHFFTYVLRSAAEGGNGIHPFAGMHFAQRGNQDSVNHADRQSFRYTTTEYELLLNNVNTWVFQDSNYVAIDGKLEGFSMEGKEFHGVGTVLGNAYIYGYIDQWERLPYRMEIEDSLNYSMDWGETDHIVCKIMKGFEDVTDQVTKWTIVRNSGDPVEDQAWNLSDKAQNFDGEIDVLFGVVVDGVEVNDLGSNSAILSTMFTITATDEVRDVNVIRNIKL